MDLVTGSLVIDMLSPLTIGGTEVEGWGPALDGFSGEDLQEFHDSEIDVFHIATGVGGRTTEEAYRNVLSFVGFYNGIVANRPDVFVRVDTAEELDAAHDSEKVGTPDDVDHFDHVRDLVGVEHLGVGSDIDLHGCDDLPEERYQALKEGYKGSYAFREKIDIEGIDHPKRMFDLAEGLIGRGYSDEEIRGILGGNFRRVLDEI